MSGTTGQATIAPAASVREFFQEMLDSAMTRQRIDVAEETGVYLVELLSAFTNAERLFVRDEDGHLGQEPLAFILKRAIEAPREERVRHLRRLGDTALYVSGFFSDSLAGKLVDVDYYARMGGRAYDALSDMTGPGARLVFNELATKFLRIVDIFNEISERSAITSNKGLLRLYERYARTGSERLRLLLADKGVIALRMPEGIQ